MNDHMNRHSRTLACLVSALFLAACSPQQQRQAQHSLQQGVATAQQQIGPQLHEAGAKVRNGALEAKVSAAIAAEAGTNAFHITPIARDGVVTLTGTVPSQSIAQTVLHTVRDVPGVTRVIDRIHVKALLR
jgi:hyperosmotically inducible periplasmic protein